MLFFSTPEHSTSASQIAAAMPQQLKETQWEAEAVKEMTQAERHDQFFTSITHSRGGIASE